MNSTESKKRNKPHKKYKIAALITLLILMIFVLIIALTFFGNPVSKLIAKKNSLKYVEENYADQGFELVDVNYNFKFANYYAYFKIPQSKDYYFTVYSDAWGKVLNDDHEHITEGFNTLIRLEDQYRDYTATLDDKFESDETGSFIYGTLMTNDESSNSTRAQALTGFEQSELEADKEYDIEEMAEKYGIIVYNARDNDLSFERAAEYLLQLKNYMQKKDIKFAAVDFTLDPLEPTPGIDDGIYIDLIFNEQIAEGDEFLDLLKELHAKQMLIYEKLDKEKHAAFEN